MRKTNSSQFFLTIVLMFNIVHISLAQDMAIVSEEQQIVSDTPTQRMLQATKGTLNGEEMMSVNPLFPVEIPPDGRASALWALGIQIGFAELGSHFNVGSTLLQESLSIALDLANSLDCMPQSMKNRIATLQSKMQRASSSSSLYSEILALRLDMAEVVGRSCQCGGGIDTYVDTEETAGLNGGKWTYHSGSFTDVHHFLGNGKMNNDPNANWKIEGNKLIVKWGNGWTNVYNWPPVSNRLTGYNIDPNGNRSPITAEKIL